MLKGIDPLLSPELLHVLADMGHGDEIVVADANFTARSLAGAKPLLRVPGAGVLRTVEAVLSLLPLDEMVEHPVCLMQVGGSADGWRSALQCQLSVLLDERGWATPERIAALERFAFYDRVRGAFAVVHTGELQPWANVILRKGVIAEALRD